MWQKHVKKMRVDFKEIEKNIDHYENTSQAFLGISLNMEIVCSILTGISQMLNDCEKFHFN